MLKSMARALVFLNVITSLLIITLVLPSISSGEIVIKPGKFDHFNISMPDRIVAGEEAAIKIQAVDAFNNLIANFGETAREFQAVVSGSATVKPAAFKSAAFVNGTLTITLADKAAELINLSIRESGSPIPILTKDLVIAPNKLNSFAIKGPRSAQAGEKFEVRIIARDAFGNTVSEQILGKNLNIVFKGDADPKVEMPSVPDFKNGVSAVVLASQKSGTAVVEVKDLISGSSGVSEKIEITNGPVHSFKIFAPKDVISGEIFDVSIVAIDRFNNVVSNYATIGSGITISSSGKLKPFPSTLPAYEFANGQAKVDLRYDAAEDITLVVTETGKDQKGMSQIIRLSAPIPERYEITTPESAVAGQKFKIKITSYNQLGHVIRNYNIVGPDIQLSTTGTGMLVPDRIPASEFVNGTAVVEVQYNKSEAFAITAFPVKAAPAAAAKSAPIAVKDKEAAKAAAPSKEPKKEKAKKEKPKEDAKKEKKTKAEAKTLEITNISIVEPKKKSEITVHMPGLDGAVRYSVNQETAGGKKWIVLKIKNSISKVDKQLKFDSSFIGNISVEEDKKEKGTTIVKIEQIKPAKFHITKGKGSLTVTVKH
jgi:hypothetical protein